MGAGTPNWFGGDDIGLNLQVCGRAPSMPACGPGADGDMGAATSSLRVNLCPALDGEALGRKWRELEARSYCSFFQSWTYTGCLMTERFPDPVVLEVYARNREKAAEQRVALALFNRRRGRLGVERLLLGESGIASFDSLFIEHNGPLVARGLETEVLPKLVNAALRQPLAGSRALAARRVVFLNGVSGDLVAAAHSAGAATALDETRLAPALDLGGLRRRGIGPLDRVSANMRYQLRRSARRFAAAGPLSVRRAGDAAESHLWLEALSVLHQRTWERRGLPGAFADANFRRFHHALIDRGFPRGEVDLLEISAGPNRLGYLLNFVFRGTVYAYQSGFDYGSADRHQKPGLTCHHMAIEMYLREGMDRYDFLGGAERYKTSLADTVTPLYWVSLAGRWSAPRALLHLIRVRKAIAVRLGLHRGRNL